MAKEDIGAKVTALIDEYLADSDKQLEVYRVVYKKEGKDWILRVFLDKTADAETEYVSIDECEYVTRFLSDKLDELDFIERSYKLEVSSPGMDRELIKESDYSRFAGRLVEISTYEPFNGTKNLEGELVGKSDGIVTVKLGDTSLEIPQEKISKINLAVVF